MSCHHNAGQIHTKKIVNKSCGKVPQLLY